MASRCFAVTIVALATAFVLSRSGMGPQAFGQESEGPRTDTLWSSGFAYDPEQEEGPHPDSDFEWWYHFGFLGTPNKTGTGSRFSDLKVEHTDQARAPVPLLLGPLREVGSPEYTYSFVSSFQRNKKGRYLFYHLCDLTTGKTFHCALVDKSLLGGWRILLPAGHDFMAPLEKSAEQSAPKPNLVYGDNRFAKRESRYEAVYKNEDFSFELTLRPEGPPMPVLGTGLTGLDKPEDQHYYTYPRMSAGARLTTDEKEMKLEGEFWYDHQWGKVTSKTLMKWCWWGLQLDNGQNLSIFFLQDSRTGRTVQQGLTLHHPDGKTEVCRDLTFTAKRKWKSPHGRVYSIDWEVQAPALDLEIQIRPMHDDHEIPALLYGRIWEGPCEVEVSYDHAPSITGRGFQEMIGQDNG